MPHRGWDKRLYTSPVTIVTLENSIVIYIYVCVCVLLEGEKKDSVAYLLITLKRCIGVVVGGPVNNANAQERWRLKYICF